MSTFNTSGLVHIASLLSSTFENVFASLNGIESHCDWASGVYSSEDSNLAGTFSSLSSTVQLLRQKSKEIFEDLKVEMLDYVEKTLENEAGTVASLNSVNEDISSAIAALGNL